MENPVSEVYVKEEPSSSYHNKGDGDAEHEYCRTLSLNPEEKDQLPEGTQDSRTLNPQSDQGGEPHYDTPDRSSLVADGEGECEPLNKITEESPCEENCAQFCETSFEGGSSSPKERSNEEFPEASPQDDEDSKPDDPKKAKKLYKCPGCKKKFETSATLNRHVVKRHNITLGEQFTCHVCGAMGSSRSTLKRHLRRTHKLTNFEHPQLLTRKCAHCDNGFSSHNQLSSHLRNFHPDKLDIYYHCHCCTAVMSTKASLIRHLSRSHPGEEKVFSTSESCGICEKQFPHQPALQRHMKQDHPEALLHTCSECNATFKYGYLLNRHKLTHKAQLDRKKRRENLFCDYCGRKFNSEGRIQRHIQVMHLNPQPKIYHCKICDITFPTTKQGIRHYRRVHLKERQKVRCSKCDITFDTQEECTKHRILHPNTCDICQKQFLRRDSLREHLLIHSDPRHQCPHCPKKFTQSSNLKRHIRTHTGEKPYTCPYCNRRFGDKSACNSHIRVHTGAERSVCNICGVSFSKRQRLNYHMRIHTGEGLIYCPLCGRPSTHSYSFRKHVESHRQPLIKALTVLGYTSLMDEGNDIVLKALNLLAEMTIENCGAATSRRKTNPLKDDNPDQSSQDDVCTTIEDSCDPLLNVIIKSEKPNSWESSPKVSSPCSGTAANGKRSDPLEDGSPEQSFDDVCNTIEDSCDPLKILVIKNKKSDSCDSSPKASSPIPLDEDNYLTDCTNDTHFPLDPQPALGRLLHEILKLYNADMNCNKKLERIGSASLHVSADDEISPNRSQDDLPMAVGDELIKHCLEVMMKDEPIHPVEAPGENGEEHSYFNFPFVDSSNWKASPEIKKEEEEWPDNLSPIKDQESEPPSSPPDIKPFAIPKIKISRKVSKESGSEESVFVAEFISS